MGMLDYRVWVDVGARDGAAGAVALELTDAGAVVPLEQRHKLRLTLQVERQHDGSPGPLPPVAEVELDYADAGLLLDALREGMGVLLALYGNPIAAAAVAGVEAARDTPAAS